MIANYAGKGWNAIMGIALVPVYVRLIGIESWGLVGFYATLQGLLPLLDLGLKTALNRELARLSVQEGSEQEAAHLVRTLETVYWSAAALVMLLVCAAAQFLAERWIHSEHLSHALVQRAVMLMGITVALQFPFDLYAGGMLGLQQQVRLNSLTIFTATLRGLGAVAALKWIGPPTIQTYFIWQAVVALVQTASCAALLRFCLPRHHAPARFQRRLLQGIWRFAANLMGIGLLSVIVMQLDSFVLIKIIPLRDYGYYSLAKVVAGGLTMMIGPIFDAMFPLFSRLVATEDGKELSHAYHRGCQLMSAMLLPTVLVLMLFAREVVLIWTGKPEYALHLRLLVGLLALGTGLNGLMNLPYALQLAYGWTRLHLNATIVAVIIQIPLLIFMATHYGAAGAAVVWILFNGGFVLIVLNLMHRRLLPGEQWRWYIEDVGLPLLAALAVVGAARALAAPAWPRLALAAGVVAVWGAALAAAAFAAPQLRALLLRRFASRLTPAGATE